ncbi:unnamed protein product, partial [Ectocarpus sp. 12 AP-2014]
VQRRGRGGPGFHRHQNPSLWKYRARRYLPEILRPVRPRYHGPNNHFLFNGQGSPHIQAAHPTRRGQTIGAEGPKRDYHRHRHER